RALAALLSAASIGRAAEAAGVSERTLRTWLRTPEFSSEYRARRMEVVEHAVSILQSASLQAVAALVKNLNWGRPASEIAAANSLLEKSLQAVDQFSVLARIEALEAQRAQGAASHATYNGNGTASGGTPRSPLG